MVSRFGALSRNEHLRTVVGTVVAIAVLVLLTDATLRTIAPLAVVVLGLLAHEVVDDAHDLPPGSNWLFYGGSVVLAGAVIGVLYERWWFSLVLFVPGLWFVLDGATRMAYEPERTRHEFLADIDEESSSEAMFRMQTLDRLYQALRDANRPLTVAELADEVEMLESRVESALGYLVEKGQVERSGDQYEAVPPRWGKATPVVSFLVWVPRRLVRPFQRLVTG